MSRHAAAPRPGIQKQLPLKLPPEVEIDLHVFCELHYSASRTKVISEALAMFITHKRANDPVLEAEFVEAKARFMASYNSDGPLRLLKGNGISKKPGRSGKRTSK